MVALTIACGVGFPRPAESGAPGFARLATEASDIHSAIRVSGRGITSRIVALTTPEEIGVALTDGFMMEPEASVSASVFHHPDATYFSVGAQELGEATAD
jgi:hypothetical protein